MSGQPGRWRQAGLFLLIALPPMLAIWWSGLMSRPTPGAGRAEMATLVIPVLAAAVVGALWRRRIAHSPDWPAGQPDSWLMGCLLFLTWLLLPPLLLSLTGNGSLDSSLGALVDMLAHGDKALPVLASMLGLLLVCLIQTWAGLRLGAFVMGLILRRRA